MLRNIKRLIQQAFHFSNREANGLLAIILLTLLLIIAPQVYTLYCKHSHQPLDHTTDIALLEQHLNILEANKTVSIAINSALSSQLQEIEGVSLKLANRIIRYRDKLGGFISADQYKEIYGLSADLQTILAKHTNIPKGYKPNKLSLNQATFKKLVTHPYISVAMAKAIINHRRKKGKFANLLAIKDLPQYNCHWGRKIIPYLTL